MPEVFTTAHDALFTQAGLRLGERLLVHGAAGGVGMAAVQLGHDGRRARDRHGAQPREPRERIAALGVNAIEPEGFERARPVRRRSSSSSARPNMPGNLEALATGGRIVRDRHRRRRQGRDRPARC